MFDQSYRLRKLMKTWYQYTTYNRSSAVNVYFIECLNTDFFQIASFMYYVSLPIFVAFFFTIMERVAFVEFIILPK